MATLSELNIGLAELQTELETLKSYTSQINDAKETAILSTNLSKKILEDYATIVNSVFNLTENLKIIDLPGKFTKQNEVIAGTIDALHQNNDKLNKLNEQYVSIFNSNKSISNEITAIQRAINSVNDNTAKIEKNIESIPLKLEKLDIVISSINQTFNTLTGKLNDLEKNIKEDYSQKILNAENNIKSDYATKLVNFETNIIETLKLNTLEINKKSKKQFIFSTFVLLVLIVLSILNYIK